MDNKSKRVLLGYSGGIDSTAVALMLQEQGYTVIGMTMRVWDSPKLNASTEEAVEMAKKIGIEHHVIDVREAFRKEVVQFFIDEYKAGRTPNPCVMCNPLFKFKLLDKWADEYNCATIATGHYAKIVNESGKYYIETGLDAKKDQSYFLWRLSQAQLSRLRFPLSPFTKPEVRDYLESKGYTKKASGGESMEVCFISGDYRDFLREQAPEIDKEMGDGLFVDSEGSKVGMHKGAPYYTVGQRRGLDLALGYPTYVLKINAAHNTVIVGESSKLAAKYMIIDQLQIVDMPTLLATKNLTVCIRYHSTPLACQLALLEDGRMVVRFDEEALAVTPGQSAVFYSGHRMLGGAFIADQKGLNYWGSQAFPE